MQIIIEYGGTPEKFTFEKSIQFSDLKKQIEKKYSKLKEREFFLMSKDDNKLLEKNNYKEICFKNDNKTITLKCLLLQRYMQNINFQMKQLLDEININKAKSPNFDDNSCNQFAQQLLYEKSQSKINIAHSEQQYESSSKKSFSNDQDSEFSTKIQIMSTRDTSELHQPTYSQSMPNDRISRDESQFYSRNLTSTVRSLDLARDTFIFSAILSSCYYCQQKISSQFMQLCCYHQYHPPCLKELLIKQIEQKESLVRCLCNRQILSPYKILQEVGIKEYFMLLLQNQLRMIQKIVRTKSCYNKHCAFFIIDEDNTNNATSSYCPNCLSIKQFI